MDSGFIMSYSVKDRFIPVLLFFMAGASFGSFFCCAVHRILEKKDWIKERSRCPQCGHVLGFADLIPLLSYFLLKGRCRYCKGRISIRYPIAEAVLGIIWMFTFLVYGSDLRVLFFRLFLFSAFFVLSLADIEDYLIPDACIVAILLDHLLESLCYSDAESIVHDVSGAFVMAAFLFLLAEVMKKLTKKENLGGGDVKLLFVIVLYTGVYRAFTVLFLASASGLIFAFLTNKKKIAFGPFLCLGAILTIFLYRC